MMSKLALLGGQPVIAESTRQFVWPPIDDRTVAAVIEQLHQGISIYDRSGVIKNLEQSICAYFGAKHAVLMSSGTAALHSVYIAHSIGPGDEVIVPAYTFFATVTPLLSLGATPVLIDSDDSGNISVDRVAEKISDRTKAIVATHLWGIPADVVRLRRLADSHGVPLLEDASHAHGARVDRKVVGTFGSAAAFSLNGPKPLSAGEGGFLLTDSDEVYYNALIHGHYNRRCRNEIPTDHPMYTYSVTGMGLKFRIHPLAAAIALDQLDRLDTYLTGRTAVARYLCRELEQVAGIAVPEVRDGVDPAWYGLPLRYVPEELGNLPIERFHDALRAEGCLEVDRPGATCPLNLLPLFQDSSPLFPHLQPALRYATGDFPSAESVYNATLKLPVWHRKEEMDLAVDYIEAFRKVSCNYRDLLG